MKYLILALTLVGCASKPEGRLAKRVRYDIYNTCFGVSSPLVPTLEGVEKVSNECEAESKKLSEKYR